MYYWIYFFKILLLLLICWMFLHAKTRQTKPPDPKWLPKLNSIKIWDSLVHTYSRCGYIPLSLPFYSSVMHKTKICTEKEGHTHPFLRTLTYRISKEPNRCVQIWTSLLDLHLQLMSFVVEFASFLHAILFKNDGNTRKCQRTTWISGKLCLWGVFFFGVKAGNL